ncbi:hypothetical protein [Kibdelosporangium philippinense]|uniref:hypothetical protein n=1 Tax=Kibdelosporangium philippinense TaxID=211113 RepID=UPI0036152B61
MPFGCSERRRRFWSTSTPCLPCTGRSKEDREIADGTGLAVTPRGYTRAGSPG